MKGRNSLIQVCCSIINFTPLLITRGSIFSILFAFHLYICKNHLINFFSYNYLTYLFLVVILSLWRLTEKLLCFSSLFQNRIFLLLVFKGNHSSYIEIEKVIILKNYMEEKFYDRIEDLIPEKILDNIEIIELNWY